MDAAAAEFKWLLKVHDNINRVSTWWLEPSLTRHNLTEPRTPVMFDKYMVLKTNIVYSDVYSLNNPTLQKRSFSHECLKQGKCKRKQKREFLSNRILN